MKRAKRWVMVLALLGCGGCQFLQNEFFFLDRAKPAAKPSERPGDASQPP